jgi:hypothetical protein
MATEKQKNEIAEAIQQLATEIAEKDYPGPNDWCGTTGYSLTAALLELAGNVGRIATVLENQSKEKGE